MAVALEEQDQASQEQEYTLSDDDDDPRQNKQAHFTAGFLSGLAVGGLLCPFDKALYLSVKHNRPLLERDNWRRPYLGACQTIVYRCASQGLYFPLESIFRSLFLTPTIIDDPTQSAPPSPSSSSSLSANLLAGTASGLVCAVILNPLQSIRYSGWVSQRGFLAEMSALYRGRGFINFYRGTTATICRDVVFGATFAGIRHCDLGGSIQKYDSDGQLSRPVQFTCNLAASFAATTLSSPFNYVRNMQYSTAADSIPLAMSDRLRELFVIERRSECGLITHRFSGFRHVAVRLKIGFATSRVAFAIALGAELYDFLVRRIEGSSES